MLEQISNEVYKQIESQIKYIAMNRRLVEVDGGNVDEFDRKMNEWCDKYRDYFKDMSRADITTYMVGDAVDCILEVVDCILKEAKDGRR